VYHAKLEARGAALQLSTWYVRDRRVRCNCERSPMRCAAGRALSVSGAGRLPRHVTGGDCVRSAEPHAALLQAPGELERPPRSGDSPADVFRLSTCNTRELPSGSRIDGSEGLAGDSLTPLRSAAPALAANLTCNRRQQIKIHFRRCSTHFATSNLVGGSDSWESIG
jgi:hypothetical protein